MSVAKYQKNYINYVMPSKEQMVYQISRMGTVIADVRRIAGAVMLPKKIGETEVTIVGKKAFLGNQQVTSLYLPESVEVVEPWAFAYCSQLRELWLPGTIQSLGKDIFMKDERLYRLMVYRGEHVYEEAAELAAIAVTLWQEDGALAISEVGKEEWYQAFDEHLVKFLREPDEQGFAPFPAGGEEDYEGAENDIAFYKSNRCKQKVRVVYVRLLHSEFLKEENRNYYISYLQMHNQVGQCSSGNGAETFTVLKEQEEDAYGYYELYTGLGLATRENMDALLQNIQEEHAELKAYLIRFQKNRFPDQNVWEQFVL